MELRCITMSPRAHTINTDIHNIWRKLEYDDDIDSLQEEMTALKSKVIKEEIGLMISKFKMHNDIIQQIPVILMIKPRRRIIYHIQRDNK